MSNEIPPKWLEWAREIQALSQTGIFYSKDEYNTQRYQRLTEIAAEIVAEHTELSHNELTESFRLQKGYTTPKVDVRGAIINEGKILLVQERSDQKWCMPGGWADIGETPSEMVKREVLEECSLQIMPQKIIGIYDANRSGPPYEYYHTYKMVFLCDIKNGDPKPGLETQAVAFFSPDNLPDLSTRRTNEIHIAEAFSHSRDPHRATAFD